MDKQNMLSAKKIKLHGICTNKWTTTDKITQYKGVIKLFKRDKGVMDMDSKMARKKQLAQLKETQKKVTDGRKVLENAIRGDRQQLKNSLSEHRRMQLAFQNALPTYVIDAIDQINFSKRKELDRLGYKMKQRSEELTRQKLEYAVLEDRLTYFNPNEFPAERQSAIVAGKVQDAILKTETALAIKRVFSDIADVMKKDAIYFDGILLTMKSDVQAQGECMLTATKLGQAATEDMDNRRNDYIILENVVKMDMKNRKDDFMMIYKKLHQRAINIRQLIRKDYDLNFGTLMIDKTDSHVQIEQNYEKIVETLQTLKDTLNVPKFDDIFPTLVTQTKNYNLLTRLVKLFEIERNILRNKVNHAETIRDRKNNSMVQSTKNYLKQKEKIQEKIAKYNEREFRAEEILSKSHKRLADIRTGLQQIHQVIKILNIDAVQRKDSIREVDGVITPAEEPNDGQQIVNIINQSLFQLMKVVRPSTMPKTVALKNYENMITNRTRNVPVEAVVSDESLLAGMDLGLDGVPTREEIKRVSQEVVDIHTSTEEYLLLAANN